MRAVLISKVAAFCSATTFLIASPLQADSRLVHVALTDAVAPNATSTVVAAASVIGASVNGATVTANTDATALVTPLEAPAAPLYQTVGSGMASYYSRQFTGARTASGDRYDPAALTAAHRSLPLGSHVQVTNPATGQSVIVIINDRGPFHGNRVIDLSEAAARQIGIQRAGSGMVSLALAGH